jgi:hypothetical protein
MKLAIALAAAALAAGSGSAASAADQCFRAHDIQNHTKVDDHTLYLRVSINDIYRVEMKGGCLAGMTPSDPLVLKSHGGSDLICHPLDLDVGVRNGGFQNGGITTPCIVGKISKLSKAEASALPKGLKP